MKNGSLRHSITLPCESTETGFSPDGLCETDIDALLAESGLDADSVELDEIPTHEVAPVVPLRDDEWTPTAMPTGGEAA